MCAQCADLNELLGRMQARLDAETEAMQREREVLGLLVLEIERNAQAMQAVAERAKTRLAGITPQGLAPMPPAA